MFSNEYLPGRITDGEIMNIVFGEWCDASMQEDSGLPRFAWQTAETAVST